ncbi:dehydration-responsive element-binding protein 1E [Dendrobium catenatum]|uniref:Dehydration-responsive element-binding protein 1F n=1 Tax=Dendrobium catenatum TaxID=906689 RepID=A0A2I0X9J9_9ASPA|nr:dehydration-responsive element-binding protein 1E [Dendrobium catenatum]PKU84585.1 Dehydration-responsive element-binding protein 1F [Dendrobium catenatum]
MDSSDSFSTSASSSSDHAPSPSSFSSSPSPPPKRKSGRKKFRVTRHPVYRGVRERNGGKWVCEVREPRTKTRIWLGTYSAPEMAARAHDVAALALRGKSAFLNFPDSAWALPVPRSTRPDDIRLAAVKAAEMYKTRPAASTVLSSLAPPSVAVLDEEDVFNIPELMMEMAAGMLITPPGMVGGFDWDAAELVEEEMPLWQHDFWN